MDLVKVEPSPLQEVADLSLGLVVPLLGVVDCRLVNPVDGNNHPTDTERVRQKDLLVRLAALSDTNLKLARQTQQHGQHHQPATSPWSCS